MLLKILDLTVSGVAGNPAHTAATEDFQDLPLSLRQDRQIVIKTELRLTFCANALCLTFKSQANKISDTFKIV